MFVCVSVCVRVRFNDWMLFFSPNLSRFSISAPSFLLLLPGQKVARGYNILSDPVMVSMQEERDK